MTTQKMDIISTIQMLHSKIAEKENSKIYNSAEHFNSLKTYDMETLESFRDGTIERYNKLFTK